ncbi:hypothetical protein BHS06_17025 [Myxococcus xanthus]|uniref:hypothetical protein n=1 Tax=Myxococcus xanthus TaxID=34 RepID=UPI00112E5D11|nr:hypothetical protein [Myxococcus xanthus]QDE90527.1 hypothetical protein BHS06_17025 [Myxococcus xanthus]
MRPYVFMLSFLWMGVPATATHAYPVPADPGPSSAIQELECSSLPGSGRYSDPIEVGVVTGSMLIRGCEALTSGAAFSSRYFRFTLTDAAPQNAAVGAFFLTSAGQESAVHPRLAGTNGVTVATSSADGVWIEAVPLTGRFLPIGPLNRHGSPLPAGTWMLGFEKLHSPLSSLSTPAFDVLIWLG